MTKKPRNRRAQDTTLINLDAIKARVSTLERRIGKPEHARSRSLEEELHTIKQRFASIEEGFYEFFRGIEAAQKATEASRLRKGRKR